MFCFIMEFFVTLKIKHEARSVFSIYVRGVGGVGGCGMQ